VPLKETLTQYISLENEGRDRDRRLQSDPAIFLIDLRTMLDVLNSSLRSDAEFEKSPLGQKLNSSIATLRASIGELGAQEKMS
jgi:hypothetical protein